jgi:hypothetical protein
MKNTLALSAAAGTLGLTILNCPVNAAVIIDIFQSGGNVVAMGSGTIDLTGLTLGSAVHFPDSGVSPSVAHVFVGQSGNNSIQEYTGISGLGSFGSGGITFSSSGIGTVFGLEASDILAVPVGYTSGTSLSGSATFTGMTLDQLGLLPGTYVYTWGVCGGVGLAADCPLATSLVSPDDSLTVKIGVPEPSTWAMMLVGFAGLAFAGWRARGGSV